MKKKIRRRLQKPQKKFLGIKNRKRTIHQTKKLNNNIQSCKNKNKRVLLKAERNRYLNDLQSS